MAIPEPEIFIQHIYQYTPLSDDDTLIYEQYKNSINRRIRETFPSIPADFELKPVRAFRMRGCGTFFYYKVALPDNKFAKVSFNDGGLYIPLPGNENVPPPEPSFDVNPTATSILDE